MSFRFSELDLPGMILVETTQWEDPRGLFLESYKRSAFRDGGIPLEFLQDNFATSSKGVLRGIHFQRDPEAQGKLVRVSQGTIWDVGVDLREGSPTFGSWVGVELSEGSGTMLYIPPGFGHGYVVLSDQAHVSYKATAEYHPELDSGLRWDDPTLGIEWPLSDPVLSQKDEGLPFLAETEPPFPASEGGREA
jgi:dTDP-4-dehydrorhamnose 3,5-epimerase